jgi:tetratricopeptide (TPR) repeat protein
MVTQSKYDFFGGYDHAKQAGLVHTSDHHVAPGKKMWTWGNAEFGYAWDRNLTDEDGPYVELMAGAYTDNQPDFSWLQPYETKTFSQFWYPIQGIGPAKNANIEAAVNLELDREHACVGVCVTSQRKVRVVLTQNGCPLIDEHLEISPGQPFTKTIEVEDQSPEHYQLIVQDTDGNEVISYQPENPASAAIPDPATEPLQPESIASVEELYLTGLHLEQYRHATRSPESYWLEGLKRDPDDTRLNNAMGLVHLRRGEFVRAEEHFSRAICRLTFRNPNPYEGEPFYNLGVARAYQSKIPEAYEAFQKSTWNYAWQSAGYYALASISSRRNNLNLALEQVNQSLATNYANLKARGLKASLLRRLGRKAEAPTAIDDTLSVDRLDFRTMAERFLLTHDGQDLKAFIKILEGDVQTLLDVVFDLAESGLYADASTLLGDCQLREQWDYPLIWYTLSWLSRFLHEKNRSGEYVTKAEAASPRYCFPARLEEMIVLEDVIAWNPSAAKAHYYLGNLYYDKRRYHDAIRCWRSSVAIDRAFSIPWRNLGIAEFNVLRDPESADRMYQRAFAANGEDARLLYEWDQLKKRSRLASPKDRLRTLENHRALVDRRDDLAVEYITLLNQSGQFHEALKELSARRFSPWEGGEGLVSAQYVQAHRSLGKAALLAGNAKTALNHFETARRYPENLGEGKHLLTLERDLDYFSGLAAEQFGDGDLARSYWNAAAAPLSAVGIPSWFQAQALRQLDNERAAQDVFTTLAECARQQMAKEPKIDYFATSLPNLLLFDDDLVKRNRIESLVLTALARNGLGDDASALEQLQQVIVEDPNHIFAIEMLDWFSRAHLISSAKYRGQNA